MKGWVFPTGWKKGKSSTFFWKERKNWKKTVLYGNNKKVIFNLKVSLSGEFPGGTMIRILVLIEEGPIQSLVGELKSYKAVGLKKKKSQRVYFSCGKAGVDIGSGLLHVYILFSCYSSVFPLVLQQNISPSELGSGKGKGR